jgi:hypothetical protein
MYYSTHTGICQPFFRYFFSKIKATLHNDCLTALRIICLHTSRHISQKIIGDSAQRLCSITLNIAEKTKTEGKFINEESRRNTDVLQDFLN